MSFTTNIAGNAPANTFVYTTTTVSADNISCENLSATNASISVLTTDIFIPVNVNASVMSTNDLTVTNLATIGQIHTSYIHTSNMSLDGTLGGHTANFVTVNTDHCITDALYINEQSVVLTDKSLIIRDANQVMFIGKNVSTDVTGADFLFRTGTQSDAVKLRIPRTSNIVEVQALAVDTTITAPVSNFSTTNSDSCITDALYINEQSVVLTDKSLIRRDANQVMFIGKSDATDVTGADFLFRTGTETDAVKMRIPRTSDIVSFIALAVDTTCNAAFGNFSAINVSDLTVSDTTTLRELEVLDSASIKNLTVVGPNGLIATKAGITNASIINASITNATIANTISLLNTSNINAKLVNTSNLSAINASIDNAMNVRFGITCGSVNASTTITAPTINGNISNNLAAGAGINLSTVGGITTITNTGLVTSPLSVSVINASTITASGTIQGTTLTGNVGGNLVAGSGINLSTNVGTGITTITNTGIITDPLNLSTLNASTINVSTLNADEIEGFTQSTEYAFRASSTSGSQTLATNTVIDFNSVQLETPPPIIVGSFVDKGYNTTLKQYIIPTSGIYAFGFNMYYNNANFTLRIGIYKRGELIASGGNNSSTADSVSTVVNCDEDDWIDIRVVNGGGDTVPSNCSFWGYKLIPANNLITSTTNLSIQNLSVADDMSATTINSTNGTITTLGSTTGTITTINSTTINASKLNASNISVNGEIDFGTAITGPLVEVNQIIASQVSFFGMRVNSSASINILNASNINASNMSAINISATNITALDVNSTTINTTNISATNISATAMTFDTASGDKSITTIGEIDAVKFNASSVYISNDLTLDPGGNIRVHSLVPGNDFYIYTNSGNTFLGNLGTGNVNIGNGYIADDISISPSGVITVDNLTSTNAVTAPSATITNISSTDLTIATSLTGAGNINITGDIQTTGIINGATLTGNIAGNLSAGTGIILSTVAGVTNISNSAPYQLPVSRVFSARTTGLQQPNPSGNDYYTNFDQIDQTSSHVTYVAVPISNGGANTGAIIQTAGTYKITFTQHVYNNSYTNRVSWWSKGTKNGITTGAQTFIYTRSDQSQYAQWGSNSITWIETCAVNDYLQIWTTVAKNSPLYNDNWSGLRGGTGSMIVIELLT